MKHVIVVGAGIAGLAAALRLVQSGLSVTLLEANDRVGGRIRTAYTDGLPVELGAEFVHGKPPELLSLLEELGLDRYELEGETITYSADGRLSSNQGVEDDDDGGPFALMERMTAWSDVHPEEDLSFTEWLAQEEVAPQEGAGATGYVEGFNAADAGVVSVRSLALQQRAEDSIDGDTSFHVEDGYSALTAILADRFSHAGGTLRLNSAVQEIRWQQGSVCALTSGETVEAGCALITLPLGVLQSDTVRFVPAPGDVLAQAQRMRMGNVCRISLRFKRRWWAELPHPQHGALQKMSFLIPMERLAGAHFNVFWTGYPSQEPVLTAWSGGPTAASFDGRNDHVLAHIACGDLARIFGLTRDQVLNEMTSHHHHDWSRDPLSQGAYSWVPAGAVDASEQMSLPVENTLFFAGEHTDTTGHWGTVHGALRSGLRAAEQVINMLEHA